MFMERKLNELEGSVLGLIGIKGPCTPYLVRKDFQKSPSAFWSGSSGTIYPLIQRLARQKLIKHVSTKDDKRGGNLYVLTKAGEKALRSWLYQPSSPTVIGIPPDPLRNRIEILAFLAPKVRKTFLDKVVPELETQMKAMLRDCEESRKRDVFRYLALRGAVLNVRARLAWIREVAETLDNNPT
jgi:DNA-binding PadR family transcriptional regulator